MHQKVILISIKEKDGFVKNNYIYNITYYRYKYLEYYFNKMRKICLPKSIIYKIAEYLTDDFTMVVKYLNTDLLSTLPLHHWKLTYNQWRKYKTILKNKPRRMKWVKTITKEMDLLQELKFYRRINLPIDSLNLPSTLLNLTLGDCFNQPIEHYCWPPQLKRIEFGPYFNQPIEKCKWPDSLTEINLDGIYFNHPIEQMTFPSSLRILILSRQFDHPIDRCKFPDSLIHINLGNVFNRPVENVKWSSSLEHIIFSGQFNQSIDLCCFPNTVQMLKF